MIGALKGCPYLISGVLDVNKDGKAMSVDFGDGTCDRNITVIYPNGVIRDMSL